MRVHAVSCDRKDIALVERAMRRLYLKTHDEHWSESASKLREVMDGLSWADRVRNRREGAREV